MSRGLHWFRNDLRLRDNTALDALTAQVDACAFVFVVSEDFWRAGARARTPFLADCLGRLADDLEARGHRLIVRSGAPEQVLPELAGEAKAEWVSFNASATPIGRSRDARVERAFDAAGVRTLSCRDDVVFTADQVRTQQGGAFAVYTPYRNAWWRRWEDDPQWPKRRRRLPEPIPGRLASESLPKLPVVDERPKLPTGGEAAADRRLRRFLEAAAARYHEDRDRPDLDGTSRLSPYLRFGAISVRHCVATGLEAMASEPRLRRGVGKWLDELVWREFYAGILETHPRVARSNHRQEYDRLVWNDDPAGFEAWCRGRTGFPFVDAGIRQLRATGWMHNRVRMIVASFLTKDLLIDWRHGERFFFEWLVDGDPASNNGGWQWAASTGTDAQPYFRIFNPTAQGKRWDPDGDYVRQWVPELRDLPGASVHEPEKRDPLFSSYPDPIVDHAERRALALERYRDAREGAA
ncbi:MAG: deoxyribodipyrimidine photo-lyase [Myxococcota bacterium]